MISAIALVPALCVLAPTLTPATVPASGQHEVILTLDAAQAVQLRATSASGTACEVVDRVRGTFARSGAAGRSSCELELLLDAGEYKVRLSSPLRGKGAVRLEARPFQEVNATPVRLVSGSGVEAALKLGQQASYWLSIEDRHAPLLRVAGRNAGDVRLWRNGAWLEPTSLRHRTFRPAPGHEQHEWWLDTVLEPGQYVLTVYGKDPATSATSAARDALTVEYGFRDASATSSASFTLPASGVFAVRVGPEPILALATLEAAPTSPVLIESFALSGPTSGLGRSVDCSVDQAVLIPRCALISAQDGSAGRVLLVRGPPGLRGVLQWHLWGSGGSPQAGWVERYWLWSGAVDFDVDAPGRHLVSVTDLPLDVDGPPQGCQLERLQTIDGEERAVGVVARQATRLAEGQALELDFNVRSDGEVVNVWFEIESPKGIGRAALERSGMSRRKYVLQTKGELKSRCELFRLEPGGDATRLTESKPDATRCDEALPLAPGVYNLQLYEALAGVESLSIRPASDAKGTAAAQRGCLFADVPLELGRYRVTLAADRASGTMARGLNVRPLPLGAQARRQAPHASAAARVTAPLPLTLDGRATVRLTVDARAGVEVRAAGGKPFASAVDGASLAQQDGVARLPARDGSIELALENPGDTPLQLSIGAPVPPPPLAAPRPFDPALKPLPRAALDSPLFFDFERGQLHAATFEVQASGLYDVTTDGLLATECEIRTPVIPAVAKDSGGGRGRNCLVQQWLQTGRYLFTARTLDTSRGRAALRVTKRPVRDLAALSGEGQVFFRVDANALVQERVTLPRGGLFHLATTAQGQSLRCRLDDAGGWPVDQVPTPCDLSRRFAPGKYLWTQYPLTVESMRRTRLERPRAPVVLSGNRPHRIGFFERYTARLGKDGKDELLFELEGDASVYVALTNGMQGRLFALPVGGPPTLVDVVPPIDDGTPPEAPSYADTSSSEESESESESGRDCDSDSDGCGDADGEQHGDGESDDEPHWRQLERATRRSAPSGDDGALEPQELPANPGPDFALSAGRYRLVTEHGRGDTGITYSVHLGVDGLLPGMRRSVPVPTVVSVAVPKSGTLRLKTVGEADVRCRLFDDAGRLVAESADNGLDWNCALAEPLDAGDYTLHLESETRTRGETTLSAALAPSEDKGALSGEQKLTVGAAVVTLQVPPAPAGQDVVQEVSAVARAPIACALEGPTGRVVARQSRALSCGFLLRPRSERWKVRLWTTDGAAAVTATLRTKPVAPAPLATSSAIAEGRSAVVSVAPAGQYATARNAFCQRAAESGPLRPCGPEASLEAGDWIFAAFGPKAFPLPLQELRPEASDDAVALTLSTGGHLQRVTARTPSLFLVSATVPRGEAAQPVCAVVGTASTRLLEDERCFAAARLGTEALVRLSLASATPPGAADGTGERLVQASVVRKAVAPPSGGARIPLGASRLERSAPVSAHALPERTRTRVALTLPPRTWAVAVGSDGAPTGLCPPADELAACALVAEGGTLVFAGPPGPVDALAVALPRPPAAEAFTGLVEALPTAPGTRTLSVPAEGRERTLEVDGAAGCWLVLAGGERTSACRATVPAGQSAELTVDFTAAPYRVVASSGDEDAAAAARLGAKPSAGEAPVLAPASAVILGPGPGATEHTLTVSEATVLHVEAERSVCGLFDASSLLAVDGGARGCDLLRLVRAGRYRLVVRPFARSQEPRTLQWTPRAPVRLTEGVGPEHRLAPGEARLFTFEVAAAGSVGVGLQAPRELLDCTVSDASQRALASGCQQFLPMAPGQRHLVVRYPREAGRRPLAFKPVVFGLAGRVSGVPPEIVEQYQRAAAQSDGANP